MPSSFDFGAGRFNYRVAGVIFRGEAILLHQSPSDNFWTLPGGRLEFGEPSADALRRELREELCVEAEVVRLLWVAESFFDHDGCPWQELALYYLCRLPSDSAPMLAQVPFAGMENDKPLLFAWHTPAELRRIQVYPPFLADGLQNLPATTTHLVDVERGNSR